MRQNLTEKNLTDSFYIKADFLPLLLNHSKAIFRGRMIKTKKAREFEKKLSCHLKENYYYLKNYKFKSEDLHLVMLVASPDFLTKSGKKSKRSGDIDGFVKHTTDIVFKNLLPDLDDSQILNLSVELAHSNNNQFHFLLLESEPMKFVL